VRADLCPETAHPPDALLLLLLLTCRPKSEDTSGRKELRGPLAVAEASATVCLSAERARVPGLPFRLHASRRFFKPVCVAAMSDRSRSGSPGSDHKRRRDDSPERDRKKEKEPDRGRDARREPESKDDGKADGARGADSRQREGRGGDRDRDRDRDSGARRRDRESSPRGDRGSKRRDDDDDDRRDKREDDGKLASAAVPVPAAPPVDRTKVGKRGRWPVGGVGWGFVCSLA
jgi:hypothetical protein